MSTISDVKGDPSVRVPPQALEAERAVLGAMMLDKEAIGRAIEMLDERAFYRRAHQRLYSCIVSLYDRGEAADFVTVPDELTRRGWLEEVGGTAYVGGILADVATSAHVEHHAKIVLEKATSRNLIDAATQIVTTAFEGRLPSGELLDRAEELIFRIADQRDKKSFVALRDMMKATFEKIEEQSRKKSPITGVETGFADLDMCTSGFQPSDLIIVAGRPSMGKTAFCLNIAENAALKSKLPVAVFSLEMSREQLIRRLLCSQARVSGHRLRTGFLRDSDWPALAAAASRLAEAPIYIDDSASPTVLEMRAKARRLKSEVNLGMIIIDYLQLVRGSGYVENRQQEISQISRSLKALAKELNIPVVALSQLSRAVESRGGDKRPMLSDLRECVTGDTLVLLSDGHRIPIRDLVGQEPEVLAMSSAQKVVRAKSDRVWRVGRRPVFEIRLASGRSIRATGLHRFYGATGWVRVRDLKVDDRLAMARQVPEPVGAEEWPELRVALLGQMIGDGSYLTHQPMRYTTSSAENSEIVERAAREEFGAEVKRYKGRRTWHQLLISGNGNRWSPAGVNAWLRELGIFGQRSFEKRVPELAFRLKNDQIALLLRHLWATDGTISPCRPRRKGSHVISYSTNSPGLAADITALLLRIGIVTRTTRVQKGSYRPTYMVGVSGSSDQKRFLSVVGAFGPKVCKAGELLNVLSETTGNTNVDTLPNEVFRRVKELMSSKMISQRRMADLRGTSYGGSSHFSFAPSRTLLEDYAHILEDTELLEMATSDLFWDRIVSITPAGDEDVYDLTVPGPESWLADGIVSHNSGAIEQDADVVMFVYRQAMYEKTDENENLAEIIVAKQRNGPTDTINLTFLRDQTRFGSVDRRHSAPEPFGPPVDPLEDPF